MSDIKNITEEPENFNPPEFPDNKFEKDSEVEKECNGALDNSWDETPAFEDIDTGDMRQYEWSFDKNGDYQGVTNEYEDALQSQHESHVEFVKGMNEMGGKAIDHVVEDAVGEGYSSEIGEKSADWVNTYPDLLDKQVAFGEGSAEAMMDMNGTTPYGNEILAKIDYDAQQYVEYPEPEESPLEGQIEFDFSEVTGE